MHILHWWCVLLGEFSCIIEHNVIDAVDWKITKSFWKFDFIAFVCTFHVFKWKCRGMHCNGLFIYFFVHFYKKKYSFFFCCCFVDISNSRKKNIYLQVDHFAFPTHANCSSSDKKVADKCREMSILNVMHCFFIPIPDSRNIFNLNINN